MNTWGVRLGHAARMWVHAASWTVILSGVLWLLLEWLIDSEDYASPLRIWRHRVLVLHGVAAYGLLWMAGRLSTIHQQANWRARRNRISGLALSGALLSLAASGLTLYYPPHEDWRGGLSIAHQLVGFMLALLLPLHLWMGKARHLIKARLGSIR